MSAPTSVEEFFQLLRKSGIVDDQKLTRFLEQHSIEHERTGDLRELADSLIADGVLTRFQAEQFLLGKWRGFTIGKYKLLERIGVGGMGQVFLCEHLFMRRRVAVKILPPEKAEQPAALGRFYREARAAGSLDHPNIVRTHDIDQDGNLHFIVMEYVDGSNLLDIVKRFGPMDVGRAVAYAYQIALGLDYAFRAGIIHRDVKPGNVLIDRRGTARILDMGLARFFRDQDDLLTVKYDDKIVLGTADYVAPEQVANSHAVDVRVDVYGLGATLYFLLAGHAPFPTGTVSQKLLWHRTKEPTPIRQIRPEVSEELSAVVAKLMAKDPNRRYQTPAEAAAALKPLIPAYVPPPNPQEMPQMCPAVADLLTEVEITQSDTLQMHEDPTSEPVGVETAAVPTGGRSQPFGPASPAVGPWAAPSMPSTAVAHPHARLAIPSNSPFGSSSVAVPPAVPNPESVPVVSLADHSDPVVRPAPYRLAVALLMGVFVILGVGLLFWTFRTP
jgi:serine/threonine protein kinase